MNKPLPKELKQKMAQSVVGTGPSLIPQPHTPKPKPDDGEPIPSVDDFVEGEERAVLHSLVQLRVTLAAQEKALKARLDQANDRIKAIISEHGVEKSVCDGCRINYFRSERRALNQMKLLAAGVDQDTIDYCTDITEVWTLKVEGPK
jgi:hypothetical protein